MSFKNPYKKGGMFEGANYLLFESAKQLRKNMTATKTILWIHLKEGINGLSKLIIEVDGLIHNIAEVSRDAKIRRADLESWGYKVVCFSNEQISMQIETFPETIKQTIIFQQLNASPKEGV